jgi:hypothetical protein
LNFAREGRQSVQDAEAENDIDLAVGLQENQK